MDAISQTTFSNAFSWMKMHEFRLRFISLKFVPKVRIDNIPALVQIMAWRRPGDKPLSEPMVVSLLTHICVTRPQWVNVIRADYAEGPMIHGGVMTRKGFLDYLPVVRGIHKWPVASLTKGQWRGDLYVFYTVNHNIWEFYVTMRQDDHKMKQHDWENEITMLATLCVHEQLHPQ